MNYQYLLINYIGMSKLCTTHVHLSYRDHAFDGPDRKRKKGRRKEAYMVESRNAVEKGSLGVRWESARRNDSKLLPTSRMGISDL